KDFPPPADNVFRLVRYTNPGTKPALCFHKDRTISSPLLKGHHVSSSLEPYIIVSERSSYRGFAADWRRSFHPLAFQQLMVFILMRYRKRWPNLRQPPKIQISARVERNSDCGPACGDSVTSSAIYSS